jgi:hypothetical protein
VVVRVGLHHRLHPLNERNQRADDPLEEVLSVGLGFGVSYEVDTFASRISDSVNTVGFSLVTGFASAALNWVMGARRSPEEGLGLNTYYCFGLFVLRFLLALASFVRPSTPPLSQRVLRHRLLAQRVGLSTDGIHV